jgi:hypothetical protein
MATCILDKAYGKWYHRRKQSTIRRTKKIHRVLEHIEKQFQKNVVPGKPLLLMNQQLGSSTKLFSKLIIQKTNEVGNQVICISWQWHWLFYSIIPNYGKITGDVCNLPYSENPVFISSIVLSLMDILGLSVSGIEGYHLLGNRKCKYTVCFFTLCPYCTNFLGKTVHLVARQACKNPWCPGCGNF